MIQDKMVTLIMDMGEILVVSGAEASRVENTMERVGKALGFKRVDVFTITTSIILTVHGEDGFVTQTRRLRDYSIDMQKVEGVNRLSRKVCEEGAAPEEIAEELEKIRVLKRYPEGAIIIAYMLIAGSFTLFMGGDQPDVIVSAIASVILRLIQRFGNRIRVNQILLNALCSAVVGLFVMGLSSMGMGHHLDKIVIGNVMLLIPGLAITSSLRDMISGDIVTGLLGLVESILKAVAIALGFTVLLLQIGG